MTPKNVKKYVVFFPNVKEITVCTEATLMENINSSYLDTRRLWRDAEYLEQEECFQICWMKARSNLAFAQKPGCFDYLLSDKFNVGREASNGK